MAPATQPAYISAASRKALGSLPFSTTSEMLKCPPGFNTLKMSFYYCIFIGHKVQYAVAYDYIGCVVINGHVFLYRPA